MSIQSDINAANTAARETVERIVRSINYISKESEMLAEGAPVQAWLGTTSQQMLDSGFLNRWEMTGAGDKIVLFVEQARRYADGDVAMMANLGWDVAADADDFHVFVRDNSADLLWANATSSEVFPQSDLSPELDLLVDFYQNGSESVSLVGSIPAAEFDSLL